MIIYQEIIAGARQPNVLQMTAVVTENVTYGVTLLVTYGVTHFVTGGVTFSNTMKPSSTNCNSISCERDHLEGVTLGVTDGVTGGVTFLVTGDVTLRETTKKAKQQKKEEIPPAPPKEEKKQKKKKTTTHTRVHARKIRQENSKSDDSHPCHTRSQPRMYSPSHTTPFEKKTVTEWKNPSHTSKNFFVRAAFRLICTIFALSSKQVYHRIV